MQAAPFGAAFFWAVCTAMGGLSSPAAAFAAVPVHAAGQGAYLGDLQARARALKLAAAPHWAHLLHVESPLVGPARGSVNSDWFYLAANGRDDVQAELDATLAAFFDPAPHTPRDEPAQCIFGARYRWLAQQLAFDPQRLPAQDCARRSEWMQALAPERIWVVFPSAYLNSPSSMFGHTLLRLDGAEVRRGTPLLAYAVNYAADSAETNGLVFAVKGLAGGYEGQFSVLPYYEKVKEYARLESRDVWEYPLVLDPAQRETLLLHLWELRGARFTYYFFTKNCAYELLTLLRVARPDLDWGEAFDGWAIPIDTLRALGPVAEAPTYRPSLSTLLRAQLAQLSSPDAKRAIALADGELLPDSPALQNLEATARARVLSVATDALYLAFVDGRLSREDSLQRSHALRAARAALGVKSVFAAPATPSRSPDRGHRTQRAAVESGLLDGTAYARLRWRPAYHDLLDAPGGYSDGQQINFLDLALTATDSLYPRQWQWSANLIDIVSIAPHEALFHPVSWRVRFALDSNDDDPGFGAARLEGGGGGALGTFDRVVAYGFAFARFAADRTLDDGQALALGPLLGLLARPTDGWQLQLEGAWTRSTGDARFDRRWFTLGQQWQLGRDLALRAQLGMAADGDERLAGEGSLALNVYF